MPTGSPPARARTEFAKLIEKLRAEPGVPDPVRSGFGDRPLWAGSKMFAHLEDSGALVFRLPADRAAALIADGTGVGWGVTGGQPLKGYLSVGLENCRRWLAIAKEAQAYMAAKDRKKSAKRPGPG